MKKLHFLLILLCLPLTVLAQDSRLIKGKITDGSEPMADVAVYVEGSGERIFTSSEGRYEIEAETGDVLVFSYTGMKEMKIRVEDVTRFLNFAMVPDYEELDEITVSGKLKSQLEMEQQYATNPRIIATAFGYIDADKAPGRVRIIEGERINPIGICILDYMRNRFSGVRVIGNCNDPQGGAVIIRTVGSLGNQAPAIFDVDGQIFDEVPWWIDLNMIERLAILSSYSLTTRYGQLAAGGVIVINTYNMTLPSVADRGGKRTKPAALSPTDIAANAPSYMEALQSETTEQGAKMAFEDYATRYSSSPYFFLDAYKHFYTVRRDRDYADEIIENNFGRFRSNPVALKALAYLYQEQGRDEMAREVYKEVFILRPAYSQSYYDMARAYRHAGEYSKAAAMFGRYQFLLQEGFLIGSTDFWLIQQHDSDNLFAKEGESLGTDMRLVSRDDYVQDATRMLFEWNDSEAEFDLQFVNPENGTYVWSHTLADNPGRIDDEKIAGYNVEEYVIDPKTPGTWQVNVKYHGNKSLTPTYLKVTTFFNYGTPQETRQVRTFKLFVEGSNQQLMTITNPGESSTSN